MRPLFVFVLCVSALMAQVAQYPGAIVTESNFKVAGNFRQSTLASSIAAGDTLITVRDASRITANMQLTIDTEIVSVSSKSGNTLTVVRGFDGTTAASHASGARIYNVPTAWDKNVAFAEIQAIQTALGVGLANVPSNAVTGYNNAQTYNFAAQTPGVSLTAAINNVVSMAPCPLGVAGTNTNHYLYISGGTGTAESVLITGGTCTSGASSGNLTFTPANAHSGAWTIASATDGIQEALWAVGINGTTIVIPGGVHTLNAQITVAQDGARILCVSRGTAGAIVKRTSGVIFDVTSGSVEIAGCALEGGAAAGVGAPSGNIGLQTTGIRGNFHDLNVSQLDGGIRNYGGFHNHFQDIWGRNLTTYGIKLEEGVGPYVTRFTYDTDAGWPVTTQACVVVQTEGVILSHLDVLGCNTGLHVEPSGTRNIEWLYVEDSFFDSNFLYGVRILNNDATYYIRGVFMTRVWGSTNGARTAPYTSTQGVGLQIEGTGTTKLIQCQGCIFQNNLRENVKLVAGAEVEFRDSQFIGGNIVADTNIDNVYTESPGTQRFVGCMFGNTNVWAQTHRANLTAGTTTGPVLVLDSSFAANALGDQIYNLASTPANVQAEGYNPGLNDTPKTLASAATLALPPRNYFHITGTTNIDTIYPVWQGRRIYLFKPDAGAWSTTTAGNIAASTITVNMSENAICDYTGNKWLCRK